MITSEIFEKYKLLTNTFTTQQAVDILNREYNSNWVVEDFILFERIDSIFEEDYELESRKIEFNYLKNQKLWQSTKI